MIVTSGEGQRTYGGYDCKKGGKQEGLRGDDPRECLCPSLTFLNKVINLRLTIILINYGVSYTKWD